MCVHPPELAVQKKGRRDIMRHVWGHPIMPSLLSPCSSRGAPGLPSFLQSSYPNPVCIFFKNMSLSALQVGLQASTDLAELLQAVMLLSLEVNNSWKKFWLNPITKFTEKKRFLRFCLGWSAPNLGLMPWEGGSELPLCLILGLCSRQDPPQGGGGG